MLDDIKSKYTNLNSLNRLLIVNVVVYLLVNIGNVLFRLFNYPEDFITSTVADWVAVPASLKILMTRPWTIDRKSVV